MCLYFFDMQCTMSVCYAAAQFRSSGTAVTLGRENSSLCWPHMQLPQHTCMPHSHHATYRVLVISAMTSNRR